MNIPNVPKPATPEFTDKIIVQLQDILKAKLSWLNYSFGRAQRLVRKQDGRNFYFPSVHLGAGEYLEVLPTDEFKNFSFLTLEDPQEVDFKAHQFGRIKTNYSLIIWVNLETIFEGSEERNAEAVKSEILKVLTRETFLTSGRITVEKIHEKAENIYEGFSIKEIDSQFLMQPFAGFRFEGELTFFETC
jgi:hypothetical protein